MFKLTMAAENVLTDVRDQSGKPDTFGVRFFASGEPVNESRLAFEFVDSAKPGDMVDEDSNLTTIVSPEVDQLVGDAIVDIETDGGQPSLVLRRPGPGDDIS
jgi:Fe-S cluster assembly iron-binding protein IscA